MGAAAVVEHAGPLVDPEAADRVRDRRDDADGGTVPAGAANGSSAGRRAIAGGLDELSRRPVANSASASSSRR